MATEKSYTLVLEYEAGAQGERVVNETTGKTLMDEMIERMEARIKALDVNSSQPPYIKVKSLT